MVRDVRAYAFKYVQQPNGHLVLGALPLNNTNMNGALCRRRVLHEIYLADGTVYLLCDIVYSFARAQWLLQGKPNSPGPELFHLVDKSTGRTLLQMAHPNHLPLTIVQMQSSVGRSLEHVHATNANTTLLTTVHCYILQTPLRVNVRVPFEIVLVCP